MHGVKRGIDKRTKPDGDAERIAEYDRLRAAFAEHPHNLEASESLLLVNAEFYTAWNARRQLLPSLLPRPLPPNKTISDDTRRIVEHELALIVRCLRVNPKSYSAWHHRKWFVEQLVRRSLSSLFDVSAELQLIQQLLTIDSRNFHCWNYRAFVADFFELPVEDELAFAMSRIHANFSNRSAWHRRAQLVSALAVRDSVRAMAEIGKDFELVRSACWTDPADESPWWHWRWLVEHAAEVEHVLLDRFVVKLVITDDDRVVIVTRALDVPDCLQVSLDGRSEGLARLHSVSHGAYRSTFFRLPSPSSTERSREGTTGIFIVKYACEAHRVSLELDAAYARTKRAMLSRELQHVEELLQVEPRATHALAFALFLVEQQGGEDVEQRGAGLRRRLQEDADKGRAGLWRRPAVNVETIGRVVRLADVSKAEGVVVSKSSPLWAALQ